MTSPNVLMILADDMRWDFLPFMGNVHNLITKHGVKFTSSRMNLALCHPARCGFFVGQTVHHTGYTGDTATYPHDTSLASWMKAAGYRTGMFGKYTNFDDENGTRLPKPSSWDTWREVIGTPTNQQAQAAYGWDLNNGTAIITPGGYQVDYLTSEALTFIAGSEPWFCHYAMTKPHFPFEPDPRDATSFSQVDWPLVLEENPVNKPPWIMSQPNVPLDQQCILKSTARGQMRELKTFDRAIGALLNSLSPVKLANTVIILTSDNGMYYGEHRLPFAGVSKTDLYECATKVPTVIRGPGFAADTTCSVPVMGLCDHNATIVDVAGATATITSDGISLADIAANPSSYSTRHTFHERGSGAGTFYLSTESASGVTNATHKLIRHSSGFIELYNHVTDPNEFNNVQSTETAIRDAMISVLDGILAT